MKKRKKYEMLGICGGAFFYVFFLLIVTGTIRSGFHLVDDHEIILMADRFRTGTYSWRTFFRVGLFDYFAEGLRFRPLYETLRLIRVYVFGTNFTAWSVWVGMEIAGSIILAYYIARKMGSGVLLAALAAVFIVSGEQSEIWWRLGPQEPTGLLLCLACVFFIQKYEKRPDLLKRILIILLAFFMAAAKESYTILLPSLLLFGIGFDFWISDYKTIKEGMKYSISKNKWFIIFMMINLFVNLYAIIFKVGVLSIEYAGIDVEQGIIGYIGMLKNMLLGKNMQIYLILLFFCIAGAVGSSIYRKIDWQEYLKKNGILLLSFLTITGVEIVLYAKSGMYGRYFVPFTVGFSFLFIAFITKGFVKYVKNIFIVLMFLAVAYLYTGIWSNAEYFNEQGEQLAEGLEIIESTFDPEQEIITCMDMGGELDYSITQYLRIELGMKNICTWNTEKGFYSPYGENEKVINSFMQADCLIVSKDKNIKEFGLNEDNFKFLQHNEYGNIYQKVDDLL